MTEAGEKWLLEKSGGSFVFESQEAEFWLRAFCNEVEKRAERHFNEAAPRQIHRIRAFDELKTELLGNS